jgi:hypothetical protein
MDELAPSSPGSAGADDASRANTNKQRRMRGAMNVLITKWMHPILHKRT